MLKKVIDKIKSLMGEPAFDENLRDWAERTLPLRAPFKSDGKIVLLSELLPFVPTAKMQSLFAVALRDDNYRPIVILQSSYPHVERVYKAVGIEEFLYLNDFSMPTDEKEALAIVEQFLKVVTSLKDIVEWNYNGFRLGKNAVSVTLRKKRTGHIDINDESTLKELREGLVYSVNSMLRVNRLLDIYDVDSAVFNERGYSPAGELFDALLKAGKSVIQWVGAPQEDRLLFKRYTQANKEMHPLTLSKKSWAMVCEEVWEKKNEQELMGNYHDLYTSGGWYNRQKLQNSSSLFSKLDIVETLGLSPDKPIAVIFSHILYDATFFYGENLFDDYEDWLIETVRSAIENTNINWLIKVHPVNVWRSQMDGQPMEQLEKVALEKEFGQLPSHIKLIPAGTNINTYSLFQTIDYGLTVRGTVGMEMPCFGIPVVTAGTGRYSGHGFTIDPATQKEYRDTLSTLHTRPRLANDIIELGQKYARSVLFRRTLKMEGIKLLFGYAEAVHSSLSQEVSFCSSVAELSYAPDVVAFKAWFIGDDEDMLI